MLNDSEDFTEPAAKKRAQPSGGLSKRAKKEVSNSVDPHSNILVHPKWENAPFVTKLKGLLKETPSSTDQSYKVDFKPEVLEFLTIFVIWFVLYITNYVVVFWM